MYDCQAKWDALCSSLGVSPDVLSAIEKEQQGDTSVCLHRGLTHWLKRSYDTEKHGPPTWRMLVADVDNSSGGNDCALALDIAEKHQGKCHMILSGVALTET